MLTCQNLKLISDNEIKIRSDLLDKVIRLKILEQLLITFDQLIDIRLTKLHHELLSVLKVESNDLEYQWVQLISHHTNHIVFSVNNKPNFG